MVLNGSNDISGLVQHAVAQSNGGYELTFAPAPGEHENEYHELQVNVQRSGAKVHTTAGYYTRPAFPPGPLSVPVPTPR